jgi:hypothetical protein
MCLCLPLQDVLADFPAGLEFLLIVAAYNNSKKPGFVPPIVGEREMDMYIVSLRLLQVNHGCTFQPIGSGQLWLCMGTTDPNCLIL